MDKQQARKEGLQRRRELSKKDREVYDSALRERVLSEIRDCHLISCFVSLPEEPDTHGIIDNCFENGIHVAVPKTKGSTLEFFEITSWNDVREGNFHVLEPVSGRLVQTAAIEKMIVPLAAFDEAGNRCGYGRGYYDSILKSVRVKIGLAYEVQRMDWIQSDPWDVSLDIILTEKKKRIINPSLAEKNDL